MAHSSCEAVRGDAPPPTPHPGARTIALNAAYDASAGAAWALLIANIGDEEINPIGHTEAGQSPRHVGSAIGGRAGVPVLVQRIRAAACGPPGSSSSLAVNVNSLVLAR